MEEIDIRYLNSVIYILCCRDNNIKDFYVGSSKDLDERVQIHYSRCYNINDDAYNSKIYSFIRNNGGFDNFIFKIHEKYSCNNQTELFIRENYWIKQLNPTLNSCGSHRSEEEKKEYKKNGKKQIQVNHQLKNLLKKDMINLKMMKIDKII